MPNDMFTAAAKTAWSAASYAAHSSGPEMERLRQAADRLSGGLLFQVAEAGEARAQATPSAGVTTGPAVSR